MQTKSAFDQSERHSGLRLSAAWQLWPAAHIGRLPS